MKRSPIYTIDDEDRLSILASRFRSNRDDEVRRLVAEEYAGVVDRLIQSGDWDECPSPEDQLPDEFMPKAFDDFWYGPDSAKRIDRLKCV
jgi:hypothetical protein